MNMLSAIAVEFQGDTRPIDRAFDALVPAALSSGRNTGAAFALGLGASLAGISSSIAAKYEQIGLGFKTLTGDAGLAKALMNDLKDIGDNSYFHTEELTGYARGLIAVKHGVQGVTSDIQDMADATAAVGGKTPELNRLVDIMTHIRGRGFEATDAQSLQALSDMGIDLDKVAAAALHRKVGTDEGKLLLGARTSRDTYQLVNQGFAEVYKGAAAAAVHTFGGLLENMPNNIANALEPTGELINNAFKPALEGAFSLVGAFDKLNQRSHGVAGLTIIIGTLVGGLGLLARGAYSLTTAGASAFTAINSLTAALARLTVASGGAAVGTAGAGAAATGAGVGLGARLLPLAGLATTIAGAVSAGLVTGAANVAALQQSTDIATAGNASGFQLGLTQALVGVLQQIPLLGAALDGYLISGGRFGLAENREINAPGSDSAADKLSAAADKMGDAAAALKQGAYSSIGGGKRVAWGASQAEREWLIMHMTASRLTGMA